MINFYNVIHTALTKPGIQELIIPADPHQPAITNQQLLQSISNYRYLLQQHVLPGAAVLLAIPVSAESISALLAIQSVGAIPVLPPAKSELSAMLKLLKSQKIKVIIAKEQMQLQMGSELAAAGIQCLFLKQETQRETNWEAVLVDPDQPALVTFSSGTTGEPKSVLRSHRVIAAQHLILKTVFPPQVNLRDFPIFPNVILHNIAAGITTVVPAIPGFQMGQLNPEYIIQQLSAQNIGTMMGNVFYFKTLLACLKADPQVFPKVMQIGVGGSPVPEDLLPELRLYFPEAESHIIYGSSEAEPIAVRKINGTAKNPINGYCVGKPVQTLELRINEAAVIHTTSGTFNAGEIEVRGPHVATIHPDGWLRTGDIGYLSADQELYLTARIGNEKAHLGIQHYQIEHLLTLHHQVVQVAAIAAEDGFDIFIQGSITQEGAKRILTKNFPAALINNIQFQTEIQVDNRHHSKILYHKINELRVL
ncbi:AMP-binding protein [Pedobacter sp. UYP1]|uniref:AMP-binding protein n=1 Tax=Pedobacter sp. UYP1 TaxID=1756396 RepID=UPI0033990A67